MAAELRAAWRQEVESVVCDVTALSPQQHPPKKDYVRAVSLLTGYLIQSTGDNSSTLYYLTQLDPRGESTPGTEPEHLVISCLNPSCPLCPQAHYQSG